MGQGLRKFSQAREEASLGSTVLLSFARPSNAVQWVLEMVAGTQEPLQCRAGLHLGEVAAVTSEIGEHYGGHLTVCERLLQLARPGQMLPGRAVFDSARQVLPMGSVEGVAELSWVSHGPFLLEGIEGPVEVCEAQGGVDNVPLETRLEIVAQAAEALQAAHDAGIIHRDVEPYQSVVGDLTRPVTVDWARQIVDPLLREDLERCFAGSPEARFAGAGQWAANLRSLPQRVAAQEKRERLVRRIRRRRRLAAVIAAVTFSLLAIGIALGWGLWQAKRQGEALRRALYAAEMNIASHALEGSNYGRELQPHRTRRRN